MSRVGDRARVLAAAAVLVAAVALCYGGGVLRNGFVDFDDRQYVTDNPQVRAGLTARGVAWAFTTTEAANWHPLTWLSHMVDVRLFGLDPRGHHAVGALLHAANAALLLALLHAMTGALWRSAAVAALFAVHPLHVESVAWAAERKDVLSTLLLLSTLLAYVRHARRPAPARLALVAAGLALGLLAKPMLVTLPPLLLLLDAWPLGRLGPGPGTTRRALRLAAEKAPLFALAAASSAVTYWAQARGGAVDASYPLAVRASNALAAYVGYLRKAVWPSDLSFFYPHPGAARPALETAAELALLAAVTALALAARRRRPYLAVGWLWYLGTLVPVIGLVQVGSQAMADRYTYVPLTGIFVAAVWLAGDLARGRRFGRAALAAGALAATAPLALATRGQVARWRDTETLTASVDLGLRTWVARQLAARRLLDEGRLDEAIAAYRDAIRLNPASETAHYNMGVALSRRGLRAEAIAAFRQALHLRPDHADAHVNLGAELAEAGDLAGAVEHFRAALRLRPDLAEARADLALAERLLAAPRPAGR